MPHSSFVQSDFRSGKWSPNAQGKMHDQRYKAAMNVCNNGMPLYNGPWTRRPGFLWGGNTRQGKPAKLLNCFLKFGEPFQLELTDSVLRAHVGNGWVFTPDTGVTIASISTAKPAVVTVNGTIPSGWANYDTITLNINAPSTSPILGGRQFQIQSISGSTFAIYDSITGAAIDGSTQPYTAPTRGPADRIYKILELSTPWPGSAVQQVRMVQTDNTAVLLHPGLPPQSLTVPPYGNFALSPSLFIDGPYFDINTSSTTATPNALSGSVTFNFSSTVGVNNNYGFQPSDVGRAFRFQSGPPAWASGTTYSNGAIVAGSDNNIYQSVIGGNIGNNPTTDNGTNWVITGQTVIWVWGYITAVNSTVQIVVSIQPAAVVGRGGAQIPGDVLISTNASTSWQLGLYSGTTGYPGVGTYYEGRLLIAGAVVTNRFDASCSDAPFNFAPSAPDGTVGDGNALAEKSNAPSINQVLWMLPTQQGVLTGSDNGEWVITASTFGDPLTPTSVQWHRVSTYGCANIEPQQTELTTAFVQREQQRVLNYANYPYGEAAGWFADNLSENADDLCAPGVAEIRWHQEPSHFLWARCNDGSLVSTTFEHAAYGKESYNGWHNHNIGGGRTVTSISIGPSHDGLTTTLYVVAYNPTTTYYEYLELGHIFDATQPSWAQNFTDGVASPIGTAVNTAHTNFTTYGMYSIIGQTVTLNMGGYDLGDYVVQGPDGHVTVTFGTNTITYAQFQALSNGTDYGVFTLPTYVPDANVYNQFGMGAYSPTDGGSSTGSLGQLVQANKTTKNVNWFITPNSYGIRVFDAKRFTEIANATNAQIFYNGNTAIGIPETFCYHPGNNCVYVSVQQNGGVSNSDPIARIDMATLKQTGLFGITSNSFLPNLNHTPPLIGFGLPTATMIPLLASSGHNFVATAYITGGSNHNNGIGVFDGDSMAYVGHTKLTDNIATLVPGLPNTDTFFALGTFAYGSPSTTPINVYSCKVVSQFGQSYIGGGNSLTVTSVGSVTPAQVDATWTHFTDVEGPAFDPTDGNLIVCVSTSDSVTTKAYWVKINSSTGAVIWTCADTGQNQAPMTTEFLCKLQMPAGIFSYYRSNGGSPIQYTLNTSSGILSTVSGFPSATDIFQHQLYWPELQAVICDVETSYNGTPPGPYDSGSLIPLGAYMLANASYGPYWGLLLNAAPATSSNWPPPDQFNVPLSIGVNYTSAGQLLRPDYGQDAGAAAGPAFGKKRRTHWFAASVSRSQSFKISTDNTFAAANTDTVTVMDEDENIVNMPNLYTGTLSTTMPDNYSWDSQIAWQTTRPLPLTITAMGGYITTQDK